MNMRLLKLSLMGIAFCMVLNVCMASSAVPMLEDAAGHMIDTLKSHRSSLKTDHSVIRQAVVRYWLPHVDVVGMSRSVLGRNAWAQASAEEKKEFTSTFTDLVVRTYSTPLAEYSGETITFYPQQDVGQDGHFSRVKSLIKRPNGQVIPLSYALVLQSGEWKIYDFSIEGVSLLQSFKNQFDQVLKNSSVKSLILEMQQRQLKAA